MRELGDDYKMSIRSIVEVYEALREVETRTMVDPSIRFQAGTRYGARRPSRAALLNALILWLAARPVEEQRRVLADGMERLNTILALSGEPRLVDADADLAMADAAGVLVDAADEDARAAAG